MTLPPGVQRSSDDPPIDPLPPNGDAAQALKDLEGVLLQIHGAQRLLHDVRELRDLLIQRRPPRVAVLGRRGSGKSSLANALMGAEVLPTGAVADTTKEPSWVPLEHRGRRMLWLDTPGLGASEPAERREQVRKTLAAGLPDVILLAARATQVDAGIDEDLAEICSLLDRQRRVGLLPPAVIAVVTRVDELAPISEKSPPFRGEKRDNIDKAAGVLKEHLLRHGLSAVTVVSVSGYQRFFKDHTLAVDWRWNLDALAEAIFAALPVAAQVEGARAMSAGCALRRRVAMRLVRAATSLAFFIGTTPIPVADIALLAPLQSLMVTGIMFLAGRGTDRKTVAEWLAGCGVNVGAGVALREVFRATVKLLPGLGGALSGGIAATGTWALGMSAIRYFIDGASVDEARRVFEAAKRDGSPAELAGGPSESAPKLDDTE